jgi:hypothetical protein
LVCVLYTKMTDFDFNIENYSIRDIEQFFKFSKQTQYTATDVELRETEIRESLLQSGHVNKKLKRDLIQFLTLAKQWLIREKCKSPVAPTAIPRDYRQESYPVIPTKHTSTTVVGGEEGNTSNHHTQFQYNHSMYPTSINPLEKRILTKNICVDTVFRSSYHNTSSANFIYLLPKEIKNVFSIQLTSFEFPHTWYSFSNQYKNNEITIQLFHLPPIENVNTDDCIHTIVIPDGNYTKELFQTMINQYFQTKQEGLEHLYLEFDPYTSSTILRFSDTYLTRMKQAELDEDFEGLNRLKSFYFVLDTMIDADISRPLYKNLGWMLGFRKKRYIVTYDSKFVSFTDEKSRPFFPYEYYGYCKSESSYSGESVNHYFFVELDDYHNNFPTDTIVSIHDSNTNYLGKNIIARIAVRGDGVIADNAADKIFKMREYFGPVNLDKFKIRLLNRFGDVLDLNQNDYSFTLEIKQIYA